MKLTRDHARTHVAASQTTQPVFPARRVNGKRVGHVELCLGFHYLKADNRRLDLGACDGM